MDRPRSDREARRAAAWELAVRFVVVAVPLAAIAVLLRSLGLPWWLIGVGFAVFVWSLLAES